MAFEGGDGSEANPYQISTPQQLQDMQNDLSANYVLINDIDCSSYSGFSSIGDFDNPFNGNLNGQGYEIQGLTINEGNSQYVGFIGVIGDYSKVENIGLVNVDVTGDVQVGGIAGRNYGGELYSSFSTGSVSGNEDVGGLVGLNQGPIENTYSKASVSGGNNGTGGLVGYNYIADVISSFSTGSVSGNEYVGGLVGLAYSTDYISNSYWDIDSSNQSDSNGGTGLNTAQMQHRSPRCDTMTGLDFQSEWVTVPENYPELRVFSSRTDNMACIEPDFSNDPVKPRVEENITFDASSTADPNNEITVYDWDWTTDGIYESSGITASNTYSSLGDKDVTLRVTDDYNYTYSKTKTVSVVTDDFSVTVTGGDSFVFEDSVLNIEYSVENVGGASGTQDVELTTTVQGSGTVVDSDTVSLDPGQTKTGTLSYDLTGEPVEPEETATVSSEDSSSSEVFYVAQYRFLETVDQLEDGQEYEFRAAAEDDFGIDTGSIKTTTTVERQNGTVSTVESVSSDISQRQLDLEGTIDTVGDYAEVGFDAFFKYREQGATTWNETSRTGFTSTGVLQETVTGLTEETTYEYKFVADFGGQEVDGTTYTATTLAPVFDFTIDNINDFLKEGRTLSIDYTVENTGTVESTQDLSLAFDTDTNVVDSAASVTVGSGATSSGTFTFDTTGQTEGVYDIYLFGAEGVTQSSVEILVNSLIEFLAPAANEIVADRSPEIEYRLDIEGSGTVEVRFDGETVDTLNAPFDNVTQVSSLSDLDRDNQSKNWNIVYTGGQTDRDVTRSFVTGFVLKETDPEAI